ncbi:MAG TPA: hypothetical protein VIN03_09445 [Roseateles sp.]
MSALTNTGGPAFPNGRPVGRVFKGALMTENGPQEFWQDSDGSNGMDLRDYFAAKALGFMCASNVNATGTFSTPDGRAAVAQVCYLMADAMLKARAIPAPGAAQETQP